LRVCELVPVLGGRGEGFIKGFGEAAVFNAVARWRPWRGGAVTGAGRCVAGALAQEVHGGVLRRRTGPCGGRGADRRSPASTVAVDGASACVGGAGGALPWRRVAAGCDREKREARRARVGGRGRRTATARMRRRRRDTSGNVAATSQHLSKVFDSG